MIHWSYSSGELDRETNHEVSFQLINFSERNTCSYSRFMKTHHLFLYKKISDFENHILSKHKGEVLNKGSCHKKND